MKKIMSIMTVLTMPTAMMSMQSIPNDWIWEQDLYASPAIAIARADQKSLIWFLNKSYDDGKPVHSPTELLYDALLLLKHPYKTNKLSAVERETLEQEALTRESIVATLLDRGVDISAGTSSGHSLLHLTIKLRNSDYLNRLLQYKKGYQNLRGRNGATLLHYAVQEDFEDGVKVLLNHQADPSLVNNDGYYPKTYTTNPNILALLDPRPEENNNDEQDDSEYGSNPDY